MATTEHLQPVPLPVRLTDICIALKGSVLIHDLAIAALRHIKIVRPVVAASSAAGGTLQVLRHPETADPKVQADHLVTAAHHNVPWGRDDIVPLNAVAAVPPC